jgi:hypothetical protein
MPIYLILQMTYDDKGQLLSAVPYTTHNPQYALEQFEQW